MRTFHVVRLLAAFCAVTICGLAFITTREERFIVYGGIFLAFGIGILTDLELAEAGDRITALERDLRNLRDEAGF